MLMHVAIKTSYLIMIKVVKTIYHDYKCKLKLTNVLKFILTTYRMAYTKKYKLSTYRMKQKGRMERVIRKVQNSKGYEIVNKKKKGRPRKGREIKGGRPLKEKVDEVNNTKAEREIDNEIKQCAFQMNVQQQEETCERNLSGNVSANESVSNNENISFEEDISYGDPGNAQTYKDRCMSEPKDDALLMPLVNVLYANNCLGDFMLLVKQIAARTLPV